MLRVEDNGPGIPEEKLDRIFDEYYQVGPEGTRRLGVGLGLAIVREAARLLGYSVSVFSAVGHGTQVQIRVPPQRVLSAAGARVAEPADLVISPDVPRARIVLLEDNDAVRSANRALPGSRGS